MKSSILKLASVSMMITALMTGCQKDGSVDDTTGNDDLSASAVFSQADQDADQVSLGGECDLSEMAPCAEITESSPEGAEFPKTITIDFGTAGCVGPKGHLKKGKIIITLTNKMKIEGAQRRVNYENFSVDDRAIEGERVVLNTGVNENGNVVLTHRATRTVTLEDGTHERSGSGAREWIAGFETDDKMDDEFMVTGSSEGINREGMSMTREITEALHVKRSCRYPVSGVEEMTCERGTRSLDFGNGDCDNLATMTKDGVSREVDLSEMRRFKKKRRPRRR